MSIFGRKSLYIMTIFVLILNLVIPHLSFAASPEDTKIVNVNNNNLNFDTPTISTEDGKRVLYYQNIITKEEIIVDAKITIEAENNANLEDADQSFPTNTGDPELNFENKEKNKRFNPKIRTRNGEGHVKFIVEFINHSTNYPVYLKNFYLTAIDIDGSKDNYKEFIEISAYESYTVGTNSGLSVESNEENGRTRFTGINDTLPNVQFEDSAAVVANYTAPVTSLDILAGNNNTTSNAREFSINFGEEGIFKSAKDPVLNPEAPDIKVSIEDGGDGIISNPDDDIESVHISGSTDNVSPGQRVVITITDTNENNVDGKTTDYITEVQDNGTYSIDVDLSDFANRTITVTASVTNSFGNPKTAEANTTKNITHTVTFDSNGGSSVNTETVAYESTVDEPADPTKEGHAFQNWYSDEALNTVFDFNSQIKEDITLYAKWSINSYKVTFKDHNGDTLKTEDVDYNKKATAPAEPTQEGYTFTGWDSTFDNVTSDLTVNAVYSINKYTVSFDSNDGTDIGNQTVAYNSTANEPAPPTKVGYTFDGWYSDEALTSAFDFSSQIQADTTLYAKWNINTFTVTFNDFDSTILKKEEVEYNQAATAPTIPTREGYTFTEWDKAFNNILSNLDVYAKYSINEYTVTFDSNGGTEIDSKKVTYDTTVSEPTEPTRTGYTFEGWHSDAELETAYAFDTKIKDDTTLYAKWTINTFEVTFKDYDGDTLTTDTVDYGSSATAPSNPTRTGYTFNGWDKDFDRITSALTVTAQYTINQYTITFDSNQGTDIASQTVDFNTTATKPAESPTRDGYTFQGWHSDSALTTVYDFETPITDNVTLYALWNAIPSVDDILKTGEEDTVITFTATDFTDQFSDNDQAGTLNQINIINLPENGTLKIGDTVLLANAKIKANQIEHLKFIPNENWNGTTSFNYTSSDGIDFAKTPAAVKITITPVNDAPVAVNLSKSTLEQVPVDITLEATDVDSDQAGFEYSIKDQPIHGTLTNEGNTVTYQSTGAYTESDTFTYTVKDADGKESEPATVTVSLAMKPVDGWVGQRSKGEQTPEVIVAPGKPLKLSAISTTGVEKVKADIDGELVELQLSNADTFTADGFKIWENVTYYLSDDMQAGTYTAVFKTYSLADQELQTEQPIVIAEDNNFHVVTEIDVKGTVVDQENGNPIEGATVTLFDPTESVEVAQTTTAADGTYKFENIKTTQYAIVIKKNEYGTKTREFEALPKDTSQTEIVMDFELIKFNIELSANPSSIVGDGKSTTQLIAKLTDKDGKPLSNVTVDFSAPRGSFVGQTSVQTNEQGIATVTYKSEKIQGILSQLIDVTATVDDKLNKLYASEQVMITFLPGRVSGIVTSNYDNDNDGKPDPIEGAIVKITKDFDEDGVIDFSAEAITGPDGKYSFAIPRGDTSYSIAITKTVQVGNESKQVTFKQTVDVDAVTGTGDEIFDSRKTISGIIGSKNTDGTESFNLPGDPSKLRVYLKDASGNYMNNGNGYPVDENGVFNIEGFNTGDYALELRYEIRSGEEIVINTLADGSLPIVTINEDGQLTIIENLIDPYGTITNKDTGEVVEGVHVELYYADTKRNRDNGITPDTLVELPELVNFAPNNNANPQNSDQYGKYAYMVFPTTDYYLVATAPGYKEYVSPTISVEYDIVRHDIQLEPIKNNDVPNPKTGDQSFNYMPYLQLLLVILIIALVIVEIKARKVKRRG
ncbi:InlB B-repeat-containing protein [Radiobacillus sp. PE A8.2]|uniref:InlB B-repeat-containing protein n=1 Tax=Radiobacillus sp. PE A8.2 TaxID=3380349 RepID=UPI00388D15FD